MNIAFNINNSYTTQLCVCIYSILKNNIDTEIDFFIFHSDLTMWNKNRIQKLQIRFHNCKIHFIEVNREKFSKLKINIKHISIETYYRYLIADLLPSVDKILYLDADVIVKGKLMPLWKQEISDYYMAGADDLYINELNYKPTIGFSSCDLYVNAGVLLLNLKKIRRDNLGEKFLAKTAALQKIIKFQDQDILNIVCKSHIDQIDSIYNFATGNIKTEKRKLKQAVVIHYTGEDKPWLKHSKHKLKKIYLRYQREAVKVLNKKIKVGLLIDEFFGGAGTAYGGYGFLARKFIAKYIPDENISIDVLLGKGKQRFFAQKFHVDDVDLFYLPKRHWASKLWLKRKKYDIYLSIELVSDWVLQHETNPNIRLILWIQDPRPKSAWDNVIGTMTSIKDPSFFTPQVYQTVNQWVQQKRVKFISQGNTLNPLAMELYSLPKTTPVQFLPNPVELDHSFEFDITKKKKQIIFLGRLEAQKRCWLFCEIAKRMPEYDFYVLGNFFRYQEDNRRMLSPYMTGTIPNLHFVGHVDGETKQKLIRESRVLISTAIWEGIPISWLECLSYGTVIVSDLERENLVSKFGAYIGPVLGDGFDGIDRFIPAVRELMENDEMYSQKAISAVKYVHNVHSIGKVQSGIKEVIFQELMK